MNKPERTCMVCRTKTDRNNLIRVVRGVDGSISIDKTQKVNGRGMYICNTQECISKAIKTRAVSRAFKKDVGNQIYEDLGDLL